MVGSTGLAALRTSLLMGLVLLQHLVAEAVKIDSSSAGAATFDVLAADINALMDLRLGGLTAMRDFGISGLSGLRVFSSLGCARADTDAHTTIQSRDRKLALTTSARSRCPDILKWM